MKKKKTVETVRELYSWLLYTSINRGANEIHVNSRYKICQLADNAIVKTAAIYEEFLYQRKRDISKVINNYFENLAEVPSVK